MAIIEIKLCFNSISKLKYLWMLFITFVVVGVCAYATNDCFRGEFSVWIEMFVVPSNFMSFPLVVL